MNEENKEEGKIDQTKQEGVVAEDTLELRVFQFKTSSTPININYIDLVDDLWREVKKLRAIVSIAKQRSKGEKGGLLGAPLPPVEFLPEGKYYDSNHMHWPNDAEIKEARRLMRSVD